MSKPRPAEIVIRTSNLLIAFGDDVMLDRLAEMNAFVLLQHLQVIETTNEKEVRDLLLLSAGTDCGEQTSSVGPSVERPDSHNANV